MSTNKVVLDVFLLSDGQWSWCLDSAEEGEEVIVLPFLMGVFDYPTEVEATEVGGKFAKMHNLEIVKKEVED